LTRTTLNGLKYLGNKTNPYVYLEGVTQQYISSASIHQDCRVIGYHAFYDCISLTDVTIPDNVVEVGAEAFYNCKTLKTLRIGKKLTYINGAAFKSCDKIENIHISDMEAWLSIPDISGLMNYGSSAKNLYHNDTIINELIIPDTVTTISPYAFYGCYAITSVIIPETVTTIGKCAFYGCRSLTSITIPDAVTEISEYMFFNCSSMTSVTLGSGIISIGDNAFYNCSSLASITIPKKVNKLGAYAFYSCNALIEIIFEDTFGWYRTGDKTSWDNSTNGTKTILTNSTDAADYFVAKYYNCYWYKSIQ